MSERANEQANIHTNTNEAHTQNCVCIVRLIVDSGNSNQYTSIDINFIFRCCCCRRRQFFSSSSSFLEYNFVLLNVCVFVYAPLQLFRSNCCDSQTTKIKQIIKKNIKDKFHSFECINGKAHFFLYVCLIIFIVWRKIEKKGWKKERKEKKRHDNRNRNRTKIYWR